ncbi:MAG: tRNA pseudouridine(55) synthase TruB [Erysipelotrichaceae bacterium]|nr:tRNA pseudouridine(55) synthase TruB [Erysipelotrichaceae bacterium]
MDGILLVNKPSGITSHKLVEKVRRIINNPKVGHTGTLDPLADGLMLLTVGKATKILPYIVSHNKEYIAVLKLGYSTDTLDVSGEIIREKEIVPFDREQVLSVLDSFLGRQKQLPPMYSAKKIDGKKLYEYARANKEVERKPADIEIREMELLDLKDDEITFRVKCSSGTYVRVLCEDIARALNNEGCMKQLTRTAIDRYRLTDSCTLEDIQNGSYLPVSIYDILSDYTYIEMEDTSDVRNGKPICINCQDEIVFITHQREVLAAYEKDGDVYRCKRGLW